MGGRGLIGGKHEQVRDLHVRRAAGDEQRQLGHVVAGQRTHSVVDSAGPIGILLLQVLKLNGAAEITVVDQNPSRASYAQAMGANQVFTSLDALQPDTYDAVVDATGVIAVMQRGMDYVRHGGKVLLFGVPPAGAQMTIEAFPIFRKGLTLLSSFTSVRNSYQALNYLKHNRLNLDGLVSHRLPLEAFGHGIDLIEQGVEDVKKVLILPNGTTP